MSKFNVTQDFDYKFFTKPELAKKVPSQKIASTAPKNSTQIVKNKVSQIIYDDNKQTTDDIKPILSGSEFGNEIRTRRLELKLTQEALARQLNYNISIIKEYENGTAVRNGGQISKIKKHLNMSKT